MSNYLISCASPELIPPVFLIELGKILSLHGITIKEVKNLAPKEMMAIDLFLNIPDEFDLKKIRANLVQFSDSHKIDMALMENGAIRKNKKLVVFDMDSTLIQAEVIDEMAVVHGIGDQVKLITERAMNGEINFDQALKERVKLLKGLPKKDMEAIFSRLPLTPGTDRFIKTIISLGYKTAIVSGGFKYFAENLRQKLQMDYAFANDLEFDEDRLNGNVRGEIINAAKKAALLEEIAKKENLSLDQVIAVGDGANDLPMLTKAGLGIAFHAKEAVKREARHHLSHGPMTTILYFLGISGNHFE